MPRTDPSSVSVKVFAPATVANVGCGFDVMGFALEGLGDEMVVQKRNEPGIEIKAMIGAPNIPLDAKSNVAGVAGNALLQALDSEQGFEMTIEKKVSAGSGLGSSASSAAGAVYAINWLLGKPLTTQELIPFAMEGEKMASALAHADNVAPSLLGGFTIVRSYDPLDVIRVDFPPDLHVVVIYPQIAIKTASAKKMLRTQIDLPVAIRQWGNVATLTAGMIKGDYDLIARSVEDYVAEPSRSILIPLYAEAKKLALSLGAKGYNISGSGPAMFAFCQGERPASTIMKAVTNLYLEHQIDCKSYLSRINPRGTELME